MYTRVCGEGGWGDLQWYTLHKTIPYLHYIADGLPLFFVGVHSSGIMSTRMQNHNRALWCILNK